MIKHLVKEEVIAKSVNPITQEMAREGDDSEADPKFVGGGDFEDACKFVGLGESRSRDDAPMFGGIGEDDPNKFVGGDGLGDAPSLKRGTVSPQLPPQSGSETGGGTDQQQGRKRNKREISEAGQPAEKEGISKDAKHRAKKKKEQLEVEKERNYFKAKTEELECKYMQLKWEKVELVKQVSELKAVAEKERAVAEKERAVAEKERAVAEKEKAEKRYIQRELQMTAEELTSFKSTFDLLTGGSLSHPPKPVKRLATWVKRMATLLINPSTKLPSLRGREEYLNSISFSIMSLFKYTTTKINAKRRLAVGSDDWEKDFHRIETLCILNSFLKPLREMGTNWVLKSFIREEIYCTLSSYYESQKGKYDKLMALARRIRASTILQSYAGNLDCDLIDFEKDAFDMMDIFYELVLDSIRRYAGSLRVEKKPLCIMQLSFASPIELWSGILQSFYKPLKKSGVWNLCELRSFCQLLVVKRRLVRRIKKFLTLRSHFDPPRGSGDLFILVKNSARSVWKFRCPTQATRKPIIVGDLVDDQIVFYEGDLPTGAQYRSEIAIVGLGLATWVELEFSD